MIERIAEFCKIQDISFAKFCRMVDLFFSDSEYWQSKSLWNLHDNA